MLLGILLVIAFIVCDTLLLLKYIRKYVSQEIQKLKDDSPCGCGTQIDDHEEIVNG